MRIGRGTVYKKNGKWACSWWVNGKQRSKAGFEYKFQAQGHLAE